MRENRWVFKARLKQSDEFIVMLGCRMRTFAIELGSVNGFIVMLGCRMRTFAIELGSVNGFIVMLGCRMRTFAVELGSAMMRNFMNFNLFCIWIEHTTPLLRMLHWLWIPSRIAYKIDSLCHIALTTAYPKYLSEMLNVYKPAFLVGSKYP